jgi:DUF4097 and DUF4098 domain-containing protein YvlB
MKRILWCLPVLALSVGAVAADRVTAAFSDPSRPGLLKVNLINGSIRVKGYSGKEVVVEARTRDHDSEHAAPDGMRRIPMTSSGLELKEENNVMSVGVGVPGRAVDLDIQTPVNTSLKLKTINNGEIQVEGVQGEIEANDINGAVTLTSISGSAVAHALNGRVTVTFAQVDPQKAMSFSSLNGDIDVTFPATIKANVKLKSDHGDVFSDFDIATRAGGGPVVEDSRSEKGKYRVRIDRAVHGTINGGGPEIQFSNFNGSIYIRKGK